MKKSKVLPFVALLCVLGAVRAAPAMATTCSVPYNASNGISNGQPAQAAQINANFAALVYCGNNIDATNFAAGGIYASQIVPGNQAQATFGGTQAYTFPTTVKTSGITDTSGITTTGSVFAGTVGVQSSGGAFMMGANVGAVTSTSLATNNGSAPLGVSANTLGVFTEPNGFNAMALDQNGDVAFPGAAHAGSVQSPGSISGNYVVSAYNGSTNQGIYYGGGNNVGSLDFNITNANAWTSNYPFVAAGTVRSATGGNTYVVPYDAQAPGGSGSSTTHIEHGITSVTIPSSQTSACGFGTFAVTFTGTPTIVASQSNNAFVTVSALASTSGLTVCINRNATGSQFNGSVNWIAIGE